MNKLNLSIEGYKCFKENTTFEFNNITLLTGANSAGKSSVIQSLLLLKKYRKVVSLNRTHGLIWI